MYFSNPVCTLPTWKENRDKIEEYKVKFREMEAEERGEVVPAGNAFSRPQRRDVYG